MPGDGRGMKVPDSPAILRCVPLKDYTPDTLDRPTLTTIDGVTGWHQHRWTIVTSYKDNLSRQTCQRCGAMKDVPLPGLGKATAPHWPRSGVLPRRSE